MYKKCEEILKELESEGKLKVWWNFKFPEKEPLKIVLKDLLEKVVDEKYYLNDKQIKRIETSNYVQNQRRIQKKEYCDTLCARDWKDPKCVQVEKIDIKGHNCIKRVYSTEGISPTLTNMQGGNRQPKIEIIGNYSPSNYDASRVVDSNGLAPTVKENHGTVTATNIGKKVRKLSPKECWRLMGFGDDDFEKSEKVNSNTQLYKQAGNSIVVKVLEKIFKNLFKEESI